MGKLQAGKTGFSLSPNAPITFQGTLPEPLSSTLTKAKPLSFRVSTADEESPAHKTCTLRQPSPPCAREGVIEDDGRVVILNRLACEESHIHKSKTLPASLCDTSLHFIPFSMTE